MYSQQFCNLEQLAKIIGVSRQTIYRMMKNKTFRENTHFKRFTEGGSLMFYIPVIIKELKPENAPLYVELIAS